MNLHTIWFEKYRPKTLDNIVLSEENRKILEGFRNNKDIPHLLFVSTPGTGKTSMAKIIVNDILQCDYLYINASDENGIDTIRHKIIGFAQTKSFSGGIKVIILDEADSLTGDGARALRNVMEEYAESTRFILTANYKHKIIPPIQSRCQTLNFDHNISDVTKHCLKILSKEGIKVTSDNISALGNLIKSNFPDFRKILNELQKYSVTGSLQITDNTAKEGFIHDLYVKIREDDIVETRKFVISNESVFQSDYHSLLKGLLNYIYETNLESLTKKQAILIITEYMYRHTFVMDAEINTFACIINLYNLFNTV